MQRRCLSWDGVGLVGPKPVGLSAAIAVILALGLWTGCGSEPAVVKKSKQALVQTMDAHKDHAAYGLRLAAGSPADFSQQLILERLVSEHYPTAREAVKAIADAPPEAAKEALSQVFAGKKGVVRLNAAIALAKLGDQEALDWVRQEVIDGGGGLTIPAIKLLAGTDEEKLSAMLKKRMSSKEETVRNEAYVLLGEVQQPWATNLLRKGLDREFGEERQQAIIALGRTGNADLAPVLAKFVNTRGLVFATLEALGALGNPETIPSIKKMTDHSNPLVRLYAGAALWRLGEEAQAVEIIEPFLEAQDANLKVNIAEQLEGIDAPKAVELLTKLANDEDHEVRLAAVRALSDLKQPALQSVFLQAAGDKSYNVSTSALDALAEIGDETAYETIEPLLEHKIPFVVMSAANAVLSIDARSGGDQA